MLDLLSRLVEKSLVLAEDSDGVVRYRMLETLRDYGSGRLADAGQTEGTQRRHRDFFLALADDWWKQATESVAWARPWRRGGEVEQHNFRAALEWSLTRGEHAPATRMLGALWLHWWYAGQVDLRGWLERAIPESARAVDPYQWQLLIALAIMVEEDGDGPGAVALAREALALAEHLGDRGAVALAHLILGIRLLGRDDRLEAQRMLEIALAEHQAAGAPAGLGFAHHDLGWIAMGDGDFARAKAHFEQSVDAGRDDQAESTLRVHALAALAPVAALTGEPARARALAAEAVACARLLHLSRLLVMALVRAAETAVLTGDHEEARDLVRELLAILAEIGSRRWVADAIELAAVILEHDGQPQPAARLFGACSVIRSSLGETPGGLRALAGTVGESHGRLAGALGTQVLAEQQALSAWHSIDQAIPYALEWLEPLRIPAD